MADDYAYLSSYLHSVPADVCQFLKPVEEIQLCNVITSKGF